MTIHRYGNDPADDRDWIRCPYCGGSGGVRVARGVMEECPRCDGDGECWAYPGEDGDDAPEDADVCEWSVEDALTSLGDEPSSHWVFNVEPSARPEPRELDYRGWLSGEVFREAQWRLYERTFIAAIAAYCRAADAVWSEYEGTLVPETEEEEDAWGRYEDAADGAGTEAARALERR